MKLEIIPVTGLPEFAHGDDIAEQICSHASLRAGDVVVVAQKIVSKAEGRTAPADQREQVLAAETVRVLARRDEVVIVQTRHGFVCANAGIDESNVEPGTLTMLPVAPDASARAIRDGIAARAGVDVGVIVSDTFGRPWRAGQTNVALGLAGIEPLRDHRGEKDTFGRPLEATVIAIADELASAAELVMGKSDAIPVAIVRGLDGAAGDGTAAELIRPAVEDLFPAGAVEALGLASPLTAFADERVPEQVLARALRAAETAFAGFDRRAVRLTVEGRAVACAVTEETPAAILAAGAALQNLTAAFGAQGLGTRWIPVLEGRTSPDGWTILGRMEAGYSPAAGTEPVL